MCTLHGLFYNMFGQPTDKLAFRRFWDYGKLIPIVNLCGNVSFFPLDFLTKHCGIMLRAVGNPETASSRISMLQHLDNNIAERVKELYLQGSVWMVRMESNLQNRLPPREIVKSRIGLIREASILKFT